MFRKEPILAARILFALLLALGGTTLAEGANTKESVYDVIVAESKKILCKGTTDGPNRCPDGSSSWEQPSHPLHRGFSGTCTAVALANLAANQLGLRITPREAAMALQTKATGATLKKLEYSIDAWYGRQYDLDWDRVRLSRNPIDWLEWATWPFRWQDSGNVVVVSLSTGDSHPRGHATTVLSVERGDGGCFVRHLSWGAQYLTPCSIFAHLAWKKHAVYIDGRY